ncbi:hypothetical protein [Shewanella frigidimarina]|uniref:hypothetical protein n=1 Tax=Shewanella frigidimarina TaxID=56812 RepID=UPI003D7AE3E1
MNQLTILNVIASREMDADYEDAITVNSYDYCHKHIQFCLGHYVGELTVTKLIKSSYQHHQCDDGQFTNELEKQGSNNSITINAATKKLKLCLLETDIDFLNCAEGDVFDICDSLAFNLYEAIKPNHVSYLDLIKIVDIELSLSVLEARRKLELSSENFCLEYDYLGQDFAEVCKKTMENQMFPQSKIQDAVRQIARSILASIETLPIELSKRFTEYFYYEGVNGRCISYQ